MKFFLLVLVVFSSSFSFADKANLKDKPSAIYAEVYYKNNEIKYRPGSLVKGEEQFKEEILKTLNTFRHNCIAFDPGARRKIPGGGKRVALDEMSMDQKSICTKFLKMPANKLTEKIAAIEVYNEYKCKYLPKYSDYFKKLNEADTKKSIEECKKGVRKLTVAEAVDIREGDNVDLDYVYNQEGNVMSEEELNKTPSNYELPSDPVLDDSGATQE